MSEYSSTIRDVVIPDLPSQVEETVAACPEFRILLVGDSGVGKSSLVQNIFDVNPSDIDISHNGAGKADITTEYRSKKNPRFVVHDSKGFEHGSDDNLAMLQGFLQDRSAKKIKDQVHAIWLCSEAPRKGSRLQQTGHEEIIKLAHHLNIPAIMVFTKYDLLVKEQYVLSMKAAQGAVKPSEDEVERKADDAFNDRVNELREIHASIVKVSTDAKYSRSHATQEELTNVTQECLGDISLHRSTRNESSSKSSKEDMKNVTSSETSGQVVEEQMRNSISGGTSSHVAEDKVKSATPREKFKSETRVQKDESDAISVAWVLAQQRSAAQKVQVSVSEGFKKYWGNLGKSALFEGYTMTQCVFRIHDDIRKVWNFDDPHKLLSEYLFLQMNKLVSQFVAGDARGDEQKQNDPVDDLLRSALGGAAPATAAMSPHILLAIGISVGIAGIGYVLFKFLYGKYQKLPVASRYLGAYIVDLTCILHCLFIEIHKTSPPTPLSRKIIDSVVERFKQEDLWGVHNRISDMSFMGDYKGKIEDLIYDTLSIDNAADGTLEGDVEHVYGPSSSQGKTPNSQEADKPSTTPVSPSKNRKKSGRRQKDSGCIIA